MWTKHTVKQIICQYTPEVRSKTSVLAHMFFEAAAEQWGKTFIPYSFTIHQKLYCTFVINTMIKYIWNVYRKLFTFTSLKLCHMPVKGWRIKFQAKYKVGKHLNIYKTLCIAACDKLSHQMQNANCSNEKACKARLLERAVGKCLFPVLVAV